MPKRLDNNVANYLDCGDSATAQTTGIPFTAQIWARLFTTTGSPKIFSKWGIGANLHEWLINLSAGGAWEVWTMTSGGANYSSATGGTARAQVWTHVLMRQDASGLTCFVNGIPGTTNATARSMNDTANRVLIGRGEDGAPTDGVLAHAAYWNTALGHGEVLALAQGRDPTTVLPGHLRGYWRLDNYSGDADLSGRNNRATMQGTVRPVLTEDPFWPLPAGREPIVPVLFHLTAIHTMLVVSG